MVGLQGGRAPGAGAGRVNEGRKEGRALRRHG